MSGPKESDAGGTTSGFGGGRMEEFKIIDAHTHPGFEKKDIEKRPGCAQFWLGDNPVTQKFMEARAALGFPEPYKVLTKIEELPELGVETWVKFMDEVGISHMGLITMDCESDPPVNWRWYVPYEYIKEDFLDKYPDRFWGVGAIRPNKMSVEWNLEQVEKAKEYGFLGVKVFTVMEGYPNDREKCYPIYERCLKLGLHVEFHTGAEDVPGARFKYGDPIHLQDIATDFPDLKIVLLHCGIGMNIEKAFWIVMCHPNVYTDTTIMFPWNMNIKYFKDLEFLKAFEQLMPDKIWYGSEFPCFLPHSKQTIDLIKALPLSAEFKRKLFRDNAENFYLRRGVKK